MTLPRAAWRCASIACALALPAAVGNASAASRIDGLIVRLHDAPAHADLAAETRLRPLAAREQERWQAVIDGAGLGMRSGRPASQRRAVGRDQWRLGFGTGLTAAEARQLAERLRQRPEVAWVEPDTREPLAQAAPTDPLYAQQWWLLPVAGTNANALADRRRGVPGFLGAWTTGLAGATGRPAAIVAVLDTGTTVHPDLAGRYLPGYDFVSESVYGNDGNGRDADPSDPGDWLTTAELADPAFAGCEATDSTWHGTLIAGLVAAVSDNGIGGAGANRDGRILPVRVAGKCGAALSDIVDGMRWAAGLAVAGVPPNANPARIVNISFGGTSVCGPTYQAAVDELRAIGVVVVAAAGNAHAAEVTRPASCSGAIGVAALNRDGFKTTYSNFGAALAASGIATVGGDDPGGRWGILLSDGGLLTAHNAGLRGPGAADYAGLYGTSFSAPLVAGALSLMLSVNPALTADELAAGLRLSARPHVTSPRIGVCSEANPGRCICTTATCGVGMLDAEQALRFAAAPQAYVPPPRAGEVIDNAEVVQAAALGPDRGTAAVPGDGGATDTGGSAAPSGGGGGAAGSWPWLAGLLAAVVLLRRLRR